jgi:nitric oxide synthase oxygenase domain/subunit
MRNIKMRLEAGGLLAGIAPIFGYSVTNRSARQTVDRGRSDDGMSAAHSKRQRRAARNLRNA